MFELDLLIIATIGALLMMLHSAEFLMREAIAVVALYKELRAAIRSDGPLPRKGSVLSRGHQTRPYTKKGDRKGSRLRLVKRPKRRRRD